MLLACKLVELLEHITGGVAVTVIVGVAVTDIKYVAGADVQPFVLPVTV